MDAETAHHASQPPPGRRRLPPRSRLGRKQIAVYAPPSVVDAVRRLAGARDLSIQQVLGVAVDDFLAERGLGRPLRPERLTEARRRLRAKVRKDPVATRDGRKLLAGWYGAADVDRCIVLAAGAGLRLNEMVLEALDRYCRVAGDGATGISGGDTDAERRQPSVDLPV